MPPIELADFLRKQVNEVNNSGVSLNAIAMGAGISPPVLWKFIRTPGAELKTNTAGKLMNYLGCTIRTVQDED
jgi:hypothetical protein